MPPLWLKDSHPNFFKIYTATTLFHIATGLTHIVAPLRFFTSPSLTYVFWAAPPKVWGVAFTLIGCAMIAGLFLDHFKLCRLALAAGGFVVTIRASLIFSTVFTGEITAIGGIWVWFLVAALHLSQMAEPPVNPASQK